MTRYCRLRLGLLLLLFTSVISHPVDAAFAPRYQPQLRIEPRSGEINVDGALIDPGWRQAVRATGFVEHYPGDQTRPPVATEALVTFDEDNLYVAFLCHDRPGLIRASYCERDRIYGDDNVRLCLDPYGNAEYAYLFYVNPYGIQGDAIWSSTGGEIRSYDLVWESAGIVTDSGYQVEMAIPFATLRFPRQTEQSWRVDFWRNHPRETKAEYSWAAYDRDEVCWPCQWGTVAGISDVQPGRGLAVAPSILVFQSGELTGAGDLDSPFRFDHGDSEGKLSLWSKYTASSNVTIEATANPDFSQIEADAGQIDVNTTFALYYPEQRPFFQEGSDIFQAVIRSVYTRSINDPEVALKATVRGRKTSIGYLFARDRNSPYVMPGEERSNVVRPGKSFSNIVRVRQAVGDGSYVGLIATDQRFDTVGHATAITHDGLYRLTPSIRLRYHVTFTHTREFDDSSLTAGISDPDLSLGDRHTRAFDGESYWGHFMLANAQWQTHSWRGRLQFQEGSPTMRQPNGLFRQSGFRYVTGEIGYLHRIPSGAFETVNPYLNAAKEWYYDGDPRYQTATVNLDTRLRSAQTSFATTYLISSERYADRQFDRLWYLSQTAELQLNDRLQLSGSAVYGHQIARQYAALGESLDLCLAATIKPHDRLLIDQSFSKARSSDVNSGELLYNGYIYRTRLGYQVSSPLSVRLVLEYNDFNDRLAVDPLLTYRVNSFSVLYVGMTSSYRRLSEQSDDGLYTESNRLASRQFFAKLQYLFQI